MTTASKTWYADEDQPLHTFEELSDSEQKYEVNDPGNEDYIQGEKVFAYLQAQIFEAKVLKVKWATELPTEGATYQSPTPVTSSPTTPKNYYLIHFHGKHDEWVDSSRLLKHTDENKKLQEAARAEAKKAYMSAKRKEKGSVSQVPDTKPKKRKIYQQKVIDSRFLVEIPYILKRKIIDDWENVTCKKHLLVLPRTPNVTQILDLFSRHRATITATLPNEHEAIEELKNYFDRALGSVLLYRFERQQYSNVIKVHFEKTSSEVYGLEHLLRLCVKVPELLAAAEVDDTLTTLLKTTITELLKYIANNMSKFSAPLYEPAPSDYIRETN